ncbi:MAG: hypothetical protein JRH16_10860 [Deltaproteobacteria bacterium]|nr:hypothetical protein [Deltaproteobacteria bacterium]MBW2360175.1 hypothetical protein [Deltaproteobacteria bacterium]
MEFYERLDRWVARGEERIGRRLFALANGAMLMAVAALCVRMESKPAVLGSAYAALSEDPFAFTRSPVGFRILTPLLSWSVGLRGHDLMWTNLALAWLLLVVVFLVFRARAPRPGDALVASATLAFSLVTLSTIFSPWYCDPATYLAVFGMWCLRERRVAFYVVFFLGLLNRESIAFLIPWFAFIDLAESRNRGRAVLEQLAGYGAALALLFLFRAWVASHGQVSLTLAFYLEPLRSDPLHYLRMTAGRQWIGLYSVFGVLWLIPAAAAAAMWRRGERVGPLSMALLLLVTWSQLLVAYDSSRLFTLGFLLMVVALDDCFQHDDGRFRPWALWLIGLQILAPQLRTAQKLVWVMETPLGQLATKWLSGG